jgi:hypothetical protein
MNKYRIEVTEEQMRLIADCLEDVSRFASGQCDLNHTIAHMGKGLEFDERMYRRDLAQQLLRNVKQILLPDLDRYESKGYNGTEFIGNVYQIYRTMLYQLAMDNDWNNVHSSPALPSGKMGTIKIEKI